MLKDSGVIAGFELCDLTGDLSAIKETGFSYRFHNPQKNLMVDLSDEDFINLTEPVLAKLKEYTEPSDAISFHLGFTRIHQQRSAAGIYKNSVNNIAILNRILKRRILFEMPSYFQKHINTQMGDVFNQITETRFIRDILDAADCGMILDLSHVFITGATKEKVSGKKGYTAEYCEELLSQCSAKIEQIHINAPCINLKGEYEDTHGFLNGANPLNNEIFVMFEKALRQSTDLSAVTLEMASEQQADVLAGLFIKQARQLYNTLWEKQPSFRSEFIALDKYIARDALIIIDMQNYFFRDKKRAKKIEPLAEKINELIDIFDEAGLPVYHILTVHKRDKSSWDLQMLKNGKAALLEDTEQAREIEDIRTSGRHFFITKTRHSAFIRTGLEDRLKQAGITRTIICGVYTHGCVGRTAIDAKELDFDVIIAKQAIYSHRKRLARIMLSQLNKAYDIEILTNSDIRERVSG
ncbi:MAG: isochorismatase family protein [Oscillospiraceae bacterium]|nr:isochorismatase family protein [Oscillospiraceae bacterium]